MKATSAILWVWFHALLRWEILQHHERLFSNREPPQQNRLLISGEHIAELLLLGIFKFFFH